MFRATSTRLAQKKQVAAQIRNGPVERRALLEPKDAVPERTLDNWLGQWREEGWIITLNDGRYAPYDYTDDESVAERILRESLLLPVDGPVPPQGSYVQFVKTEDVLQKVALALGKTPDEVQKVFYKVIKKLGVGSRLF